MGKQQTVSGRSSLVGYGVAFVGFFMVSLLLTAPAGVVNRFLPASVRLSALRGDLYTGQWQGVQIDGKPYPLTCAYRRQSLRLTSVTYRLQCSAPLDVALTLTAAVDGTITVTDGLFSGNLKAAAAWVSLLGLPGISGMPRRAQGEGQGGESRHVIGGRVGLNVKKAVLENVLPSLSANSRLVYLDVSGGGQQLTLFGQSIFAEVRLTTRQPELRENQTITLEWRTVAATESNALGGDSRAMAVHLYANTDIDGRNYRTTGEISGKSLRDYVGFLRFFGRQTGNETFAVQLQGALF